MNAPTPAQIREYGAAANAACRNLGIVGDARRREYRHRVIREATGRESVRDIRSSADYDTVMARLWSDAGDYGRAIHYRINSERRQAYVIRVLACQLMQLKGGDGDGARRYVGGVLDQARIAHGRRDDGAWWMDVAEPQLSDLVKMLDTERRRILRRFTASAGRLSFSDRVRYEADGTFLVFQVVPKGYYSSTPRIRFHISGCAHPCARTSLKAKAV